MLKALFLPLLLISSFLFKPVNNNIALKNETFSCAKNEQIDHINYLDIKDYRIVLVSDDEDEEENVTPNVVKEPTQDEMITLVLTIAAFGMTFIGAFYLLKDKNIIK